MKKRYYRVRTDTPGKCNGCIFEDHVSECFSGPIQCIDKNYNGNQKYLRYGIYIEIPYIVNINIRIL